MAAIVAGVAVGLLRGGRIGHLARLPWSLFPLALVALTLQVLMQADFLSGVRVGLLLASYAIVGVALLYFVRRDRLPGLGTAVIGAGWALNCAPIAANGAMPVSARALDIAGIEDDLESGDFVKHELMTSDTYLRILGDVIPIPPPGGVVISIGDIVLLIGFAIFVAQAMTMRHGETDETRASASAEPQR